MKKRSIKMLTLLAATTIGVSLFAGCGSKPKESDAGKKGEQVLNIAVFEGGHGSEYWKEVSKRFEEKNPGVKVNVEANPKIGEIIRPKITSGDAPDFIYLGSTDPSGLANALIKDNALEDLTDVFDGKNPDGEGKLKDKILDGFLNTSLTAPYGDGKVFLAPLYYNVTGLWYNKTYFEKKGYKAPETWDQFFALGDKAKKDGKALFTYQGLNPSYNEALIWPMIASAGGEKELKAIFNYDKGAWESNGAKKALEVFEKIGKDGYLLKGTVGMSHTLAQQAFLDGKALFIPNGNWFEDEMKETIPKEGFSFGFMAPPVFKSGDTRYATTMIEQMYIPKEAKNKDLAKKFLAFQYEDENVKLNSKLSGGVVPIKKGLELAKENLNQSNYECFKIFEEGVKPITVDFKTVKSEVNIADEVYNPLASIMNKELTAKQWAEKLEKADAKLREAASK
ncbi:N-acetylglucosamine transport system substrate-binding protein [Clostridium moniliforme]|uniref:N-acetylglucosamine transport system substrate-binding protein n=1 Tax=Clostridium moniliforme TaxID=39489 RepID=A0ABS4EZV2_9CLOT|nr:carbohydrate ABC transporter substrate-binding protein [Clostridium moniliforme]MBP1889522.1 N-acetylglucosamine transport system substrate-binding protein [Clostridium moniliforme]